MPSVTMLPLVALAAVAATAAALLLLATSTWGLGVSYDSVAYLQASDDLSVDVPQPRDQGDEPLYWWAPGYPVALRVVGDGHSNARILHALLLFAGTILIGAVAWRAIGPGAGVTAGALYAFSPVLFAAHLELLAEPLYLVLATAALALMANRRPALAGVATAAAILTRYAGLPLIITGAIVLRGRDRLVFLALSIAPYLAWLVRNELVAGQATGRELRWHPASAETAADGLHAVQDVLLTPGELGSISLPFGDSGLVLQLAVAITLVVALVRAERRMPPSLVTTALVYAVLYCGFLVVTVSLFDAATPVNERLLVPIVPPLALAVAWLVRSTPVVAAILCTLFAVAVAQQTRTVHLYGIHYSGRLWSVARFDGASLPSGDLYSNWPAAIAYFTNRSPRRLPQPREADTLDANLDFDRELADLTEDVRAGRASVVILADTEFAPASGAARETLVALGRSCRPVTAVVTVCSAGETRRVVGRDE